MKKWAVVNVLMILIVAGSIGIMIYSLKMTKEQDMLANQRLSAIELNISALQQQLQQVSEQPSLEIAYYLNRADMYLVVLKDVNTALQLLEWIQISLAQHAPMGLQQALNADIAALKAVRVPDIKATTQILMHLEEQVLHLPLRARFSAQKIESTSSSTTVDTWQQGLKNTWNELKNLIRVQPRNTSMDYVFFDETILRQTVKVELRRASIAATLGQTDLYQASLLQAQIALEQFFDESAPSVQEIIGIINNLLQQPITIDVPPVEQTRLWLQHHKD